MKRKRPEKFGLHRSQRTPQINWALDFDYLAKLSADDRAWLEQFAYEFYRSAPKPVLHSPEQQRANWREFKANQRDVMSRGDAYGGRQECSAHQAHGLRQARVLEAGEFLRQHELLSTYTAEETTVITGIDSKRAAGRAKRANKAATYVPTTSQRQRKRRKRA
jgi:hypothetical protein